MNPIQQALSLKSELDTLRPIAAELEARVMQKLRLDWNYHSNHLEGNSLTYGETKALILHGITAQGKPLKDHTEVEGHNEAVKWVYEIAKDDRPLTESFIRELHTLLLVKPYKVRAETADGIPTWKVVQVGRYKESNNHVFTKTGERQEFVNFQDTPKAMQDLMDWYKVEKSKLDVNPIFLATAFHHKFIAIHPFDDGNGRTVRLLMNYILMQFGYPPVIIKTEDKDSYFSVLQVANAGNIEPFFEFIANNLSRSLQLMIAGAKGESVEEPDDLDKELALLEQKLNVLQSETKIFKSNNSVADFYQKNIRENFIWDFEINSQKFRRFYKERIVKQTFTYVDAKNLQTQEYFEQQLQVERSSFNSELNRITISCGFYATNDESSTIKNYSDDVDFIFTDQGVMVSVRGFPCLSVKYDEKITSSDYEKIYDALNKLHITVLSNELA
jgi:Fic family protein